MTAGVCFHGRETCPFCFTSSARSTIEHRRRPCATCGRKLAQREKAERCARCRIRKFVALRLFR